MRYKAFSENYEKRTRVVFLISLALSLAFIALLLYFVSWFVNLTDPKLILMLWIVPISLIILINSFIMAISMSQNSINKFIGKRRYVNIQRDFIVLEDTIKTAYYEHTFAWDDIKRILISYSMPFDRYRKRKQYVVTFIINQQDYTKYKNNAGKDRLEHVKSFFYLRYNPEMIADIEQFWHGKIERYDQNI